MSEIEFVNHLSVDNVIFGYHEKEIKVLLLRLINNTHWMLPGGFIKHTESILDAAKRVAHERTGLSNLYLEQFKSYGDPQRNIDPNAAEIDGTIFNFDSTRFEDLSHVYFATIAFYTLTEFSKVEVHKGVIDEEARWFSLNEIPHLLYDHRQILEDALIALRLHVNHFPIGKQLLEEKFTIPEIQALYETILGKTLDRRNFSKKIINSGILTKLDEQKNIGAHRSPNLYKFNEERYIDALKNGLILFV